VASDPDPLALRYLDEKQIAWLLDQNVPDDEIAQLRCATVIFQKNNLFDFAESGAVAVIFDDGDGNIFAWSVRSGALAARDGCVSMTDEAEITNPANTLEPDPGLRVYLDPLAWLKARRDGVLIIRPAFAATQLRLWTRLLVVSGKAEADRLGKLLIPRLPRITVRVREEGE
jgi:hypothetical protein